MHHLRALIRKAKAPASVLETATAAANSKAATKLKVALPRDPRAAAGAPGLIGGDGPKREARQALVDRLPTQTIDPFEEFDVLKDRVRGEAFARMPVTHRMHRLMQIRKRVARRALSNLGSPSSLALIGGSGILVAALGSAEALFLCNDPLHNLSFALRYGIENVLPSCLWTSVDAKLVAQAMGLDPDVVLRTFDSTMEQARYQLGVLRLRYVRSVLAPMMMLAQIARLVQYTAAAGKGYDERCKLGQEPPLSGVNERVIRLCGRLSDVTSVSLSRYGDHLVPVYEQPELIQYVVERVQNVRGSVPVYWNVAEKDYSHEFAWRNLGIDETWFVKTTTGRRLLYIEADATNPDDVLTGDCKDLSLEDASLAFRQLELAARRQSARFRPFRVFLGDTFQTEKTGAGRDVTLRQRVAHTQEADVVVDSRAPILLELIRWVERLAADDRRARLAAEADAAAAAELAAAAAASTSDQDAPDAGDAAKPAPVPRKAPPGAAAQLDPMSFFFGRVKGRDHLPLAIDTGNPTYFKALAELLNGYGECRGTGALQPAPAAPSSCRCAHTTRHTRCMRSFVHCVPVPPCRL